MLFFGSRHIPLIYFSYTGLTARFLVFAPVRDTRDHIASISTMTNFAIATLIVEMVPFAALEK